MSARHVFGLTIVAAVALTIAWGIAKGVGP